MECASGKRTEAAAGARCLGRAAALLCGLGLVQGLATGPLAAEQEVPELSGRVVDRAGVLSSATETSLETILAGHEAATGNQVAVLTVPSLQGEAVESFSLRVAEAWALGTTEEDNGVLVLVATGDRRMRIEVGYGLEGALPDVLAGRIIRDEMAPRFRRGDFDAGVLVAVQRIVEHLDTGEGAAAATPGATPPPVAAAAAPPHRTDWGLIWASTVFFLLMPLIGSVYGLVAESRETRGIVFGFMTMPIFLAGALIADELGVFSAEGELFLLGGVLLLAVYSALFWWGRHRLECAPEARQRWRERLDRLAGGDGLGSSGADGGLRRWLRRALVAAVYLGVGLAIAWRWNRGYAIFYFFNLSWLFWIYRAALYPSPATDSGGWSGRSSKRAVSTGGFGSWRTSRSTGGGFRGGGGSFGGGGASGSW